jgi:hypothetical protein
MKRRTLLKTGGLAAIVTLTLGNKGCTQKISFYVSTVIGSLEALSPLLPSASGLITKAVAAAKAFDEAYRAGKFADSTALFANLGDLAMQIAELAGVASPQIKIAIAVGRVALNAIASILKSQLADPVVAGIVAARSDAAAVRQKAMIERFADEKMIETLFQSAKP